MQLVVHIGPVLQQGVHHLGVAVLSSNRERCAAVLTKQVSQNTSEEQ